MGSYRIARGAAQTFGHPPVTGLGEACGIERARGHLVLGIYGGVHSSLNFQIGMPTFSAWLS